MYRIISKSGRNIVCSYWTTVYVRRKDGSNSIELRYKVPGSDRVFSLDMNDLETIKEVQDEQ